MEVIAYLDDGREWGKENIDAANLTCINYAFGVIVDGQVHREFKKIHLVNELKEEHPHLKTCLSIGGWTADGFSDAVLTEGSRHVFIDSIVEYIIRYDFDGVDLDWEYPKLDVAGIKAREEDSENLLLLLRTLRSRLDELEKDTGKPYLLTIAVGAAPHLLETTATGGGHEYVAYLDYINIMTYDMRGSYSHTTGHHTNVYPYSETDTLSAKTSVDYLMSKGIPANKLVIGGAFYGRMWKGVLSSDNNGLMQEAKQTGSTFIDYNDLRERLEAHPEYCFYDEIAGSPYYFDGENYISYDNEQSFAEKVRYCQAEGLRGIMYWEHSLDLSHRLFHSIIEARDKK